MLVPGWNSSEAIYGTFGNIGTGSTQLSDGQGEPIDDTSLPTDVNPDGTPVGTGLPPVSPSPDAGASSPSPSPASGSSHERVCGAV